MNMRRQRTEAGQKAMNIIYGIVIFVVAILSFLATN